MNGFGSIFDRLFPGKDCSVILKDPDADPMDKEICQSFQEFASSFPSMDTIVDNDENNLSEDKPDPQALRDSLLKKTPSEHFDIKQRQHSKGDENLDDHVAKGVDPSLLVEPDRPRKGMRKGYSSFTRVVVTTRPDGTIEEKRTHHDSKGNETETTIIREPRDSHPAISTWDKLSDKLSDWVWPKK